MRTFGINGDVLIKNLPKLEDKFIKIMYNSKLD